MVHDSYVDQVVARVHAKMLLRELAPNTIETYVRCVRRFIARVGKPLGAVKAKDVEQYLLDLVHQDRSPGTRNVNLAAIRFALRACLRRDPCKEMQPAKVRRRSPEILSGSEVSRLLDATTSLKYRAIFMLAYGAGLRISELVSLETTDIDSERMLLHVRESKTGPRYVMMSPRVLEALRAYWRAFRPRGPRLFPGRKKGATDPHLSREAVHRVLAKAALAAGITKTVSPHTLPQFRHALAGNRRRRAGGAIAARPRLSREHSFVPAPDDRAAAAGAEPTRPDRDRTRTHARLKAGACPNTPDVRRARRRSYTPSRGSRWPRSFGATSRPSRTSMRSDPRKTASRAM
jgi:integrase/recombinase XerD